MRNLFLPLDVQCSMLDVRRFRADLDENFLKILVAGVGVACGDFYRFDECAVGRADVAIHCSVFALVETGDDAAEHLDDHRVHAPLRARGRIRGSGFSDVACASLGYKRVHADVDSVWCNPAGVCPVRRERRISPNLC